MKRGNQNVVGEKYVLDDSANLCFDTLTKSNASIKDYNQDYVWYQSCLSTSRPVVHLSFRVTANMVYNSVKKIKSGKEAGSAGFVSEMLIAGGEVCTEVVC